MSEPIQIPTPILTNLTHAAEQAGIALDAQAKADAPSPQTDALQRQLDTLRAQHPDAGRAKAQADEPAAMYRNAAHGLAAHIDGLARQTVEAAEPPPIPPAQ